MKTILQSLTLAVFLWSPAQAAVSVSNLFANNMMFQRGQPIKVFGKAAPGESVAVSLAGNSQSTTADGTGKWLVTLPSLTAGGPHTLTINQLTFNDVLIGDVWFCSGQSNIQIKLNSDAEAASEVPNANYPNIRILRVNTVFPTSDTSLPTLIKWSKVTPDTAKNFSAVGYYFGRDLHNTLNVPIGLIDITRGGTKAEAWTPADTFDSHPVGRAMLEYYNNLPATHPEKQAQDAPGALYPVFVEPLAPFGMKGVLWYQGEHNTGRNIIYHYALSNMIGSWRSRLQQPALPFVVVQLPNYGNTTTALRNSDIANLRGIQAAVADSLPNVEYTVNIDLGDSDGNIHPSRKQPVGKRAALAALKSVYGQNPVWTGPRFSSATYNSSEVTLNFDLMGGPGLASVTNPNGFLVSSGKAGGFVRANAQVIGNTVKLTGVNNPVAARYAWEDMPRVNLFTTGQLPIAPFRTDAWHPDNLAPATWASVSTKDPLLNEDNDNYPNYVEFFANTDFRGVTNEPIIWSVASPFPNTTAFRYRRRDNLWPSITYKIQTSPVGQDNWTDLAYVDYPATSTGAVHYQVDYERYEIHVPGNVKVRLAISLNGQTYLTQGAAGGGNLPPSSSITSPANQSIFAPGSAILVNAAASDDESVAHVELHVNNVQYGASDTTPPYSWSVTGLANGNHALHVVSQDNTGLRTTSSTVNLTVSDPTAGPEITDQPDNLTVTAGQNAGFSVSATGSNLTYFWRKDEGPINAGNASGINTPNLTLTNATAANAGIYSVIVSDGVHPSVTSDDVTLTVNPAPDLTPAVVTSSLPAARVGLTYQATLAATSGNPPFSWSASGLPAFLPLASANGLISGTPPVSGVFPIVVTVTDADGDQASAALPLVIDPAPSGSGWLESDGSLVMEAEDAAVLPVNDTFTWLAKTADGVTYMDADNGSSTFNITTWENGTELKFTVTITNAGAYSLAARRLAPSGSSDSAFVGVDGVQVGGTQFSGTSVAFAWTAPLALGNLTAGQHEIQIRRRETHFKIDRVMLALTTDTFPTGAGVGPAADAPSTGTTQEPAGFERWRVIHFTPSQLTDLVISGPQAAPLADGLPNKLRFALGRSPWERFTPIQTAAALPDGRPAFRFTRSLAPGAPYPRIEVSNSLTGWTSQGSAYQSEIAATGPETETLQIAPPAGSIPPAWFLRLGVD